MQTEKRGKTGLILLAVGALCVLLRLITKGPGWTFGAIVFLLVGALVEKSSKKRIRTQLGGQLSREAVQAVFPGAEFTPERGISSAEARDAAILVPGGYEWVKSSNGIRGSRRGVPFELSTAELLNTQRIWDEEMGMDRDCEQRVLYGTWLILRGAPLATTVRLESRRGPLKGIRTGLQTGNEEFDRAFTIQADEPEQLERVLTPALCQRLTALQSRSGKLYLTFLREGLIHIVRDTGRGLFEAKGTDAAQLREAYLADLRWAADAMDAACPHAVP